MKDLSEAASSGAAGDRPVPSAVQTPAAAVFKRDEIGGSIVQRFEKQVDAFPDQLALKDAGYVYTYRTLNEAINRVAHKILAHRGAGTEPVALLLEHGAPMVIALLAVLKVGKIYVAFDPSYPKSRLASILADLQNPLVLTNDRSRALAVELAGGTSRVLSLEEVEDVHPGQNPELQISPDTPAVIYYTSGSTGQPKGVVRDHRHVLHGAWVDANTRKTSSSDCQSLLFYCNFSASQGDIFNALLNGACLYPYDFRKRGLDQMASWLIEEQITLLHSPIALFRQFLDTLEGARQPFQLRLIHLGGDAIDKRDVERIRRAFSPHCILEHRLSATETGNMTRINIDKETSIGSGVVPAGYAVADKEIQILDEDGRLVGFNQVGEIAVRSRYLAVGYWRKPELTRQKFLPDPDGGDQRIYLTGDLGRLREDGCLEHLGRKDFQVKIRGYRVETSEIVATLNQLAAVQQSVVVALEDASGENRLVAYVVPTSQPGPKVGELRTALAAELPDYMIPSTFMTLHQLPLTPNGKVDRRALPPPDLRSSRRPGPYMAPRTPTEAALAEIWSLALGVNRVGVSDNFFELGGHSLMASRILAQLRREFDIDLTLREFFELPTIAELAPAIDGFHTPSRSEGDQDEAARLDNALRMLGDF